MNPDDHDWQKYGGTEMLYVRWQCSKCGVSSHKDKMPKPSLKRLYIAYKRLGKISCGAYLAYQLHED